MVRDQFVTSRSLLRNQTIHNIFVSLSIQHFQALWGWQKEYVTKSPALKICLQEQY